MAFHIPHDVGLGPAPVLVRTPVQVGSTAARPSAGGAVIIIVSVPPQHHSVIGKDFFLAVIGKVLKDKIC